MSWEDGSVAWRCDIPKVAPVEPCIAIVSYSCQHGSHGRVSDLFGGRPVLRRWSRQTAVVPSRWGRVPLGSTADSCECPPGGVASWCSVWVMNSVQRGDVDVLVHVATGSLSLDALDATLRTGTGAVAALPTQSSLRSYLRDLALGRC